MMLGRIDGQIIQQYWVRVDGRQQASVQDGKLQLSPLLPVGGRALPGGWPNVSFPYLNSLPSNPAKLETIIEAG
jgi:hypothetical protein